MVGIQSSFVLTALHHEVHIGTKIRVQGFSRLGFNIRFPLWLRAAGVWAVRMNAQDEWHARFRRQFYYPQNMDHLLNFTGVQNMSLAKGNETIKKPAPNHIRMPLSSQNVDPGHERCVL